MRIRKIVLICVTIILISNVALAKYIYEFSENIVTLTRDSTPIYAKISYSIEELTNKNVIVKVICNKEIEHVSGFDLLEDNKTLIKEFSYNESGKIKIRDLSGNEIEVEYNVNNIDKESPIIKGCENNGIYQAPLVLDYLDNQGIKNVIIDRYNDCLSLNLKKEIESGYMTVNVEEHPLNTIKYKYYINEKLYSTTVDEKYTFVGLENTVSYTVKVQALDKNGNILDEKEEILKNIDILNENNLNIEDNNERDIYFIDKSGNYKIKVIDLAENETVYNIKVK